MNRVVLLAVALVVSAIAVDASTIYMWLDHSCEAPARRVIMKASGSVGCFEFWLNRYQTTLQTVISAAIGIMGLYFVLSQLKALGEQNDVARAALQAETAAKSAIRRITIAKAINSIDRFIQAAMIFHENANSLRKSGKCLHSEDDLRGAMERALADMVEIYPALETDEVEANWNEIESLFRDVASYLGLRANGHSSEDIAQAIENSPATDLDAMKRAVAVITRAGVLRQKLVRLRGRAG